MSAKIPTPTDKAAQQLKLLGEQIRARRKAMKVSSTATAEAAGISRVTLHRIEKGEPSVAAGAWASVAAVLNLVLDALPAEAALERKRANRYPPFTAGGGEDGAEGTEQGLDQWMPVRIRLADYPQLRALAWQVNASESLKPREALDIYERNARHLDLAAMTPDEAALLAALREGLGEPPARR
ncbi:helix-turn-helix transcriptional regulator [Hydrogenophaga sp. 5NK40-0174]|uniref:helix-turn-helix domain-containing protein n=1 Tax=Hydrogenophaga sp. 5NK40-0174 TaxID=3127649 RepID=UPI003106AA55